MDPLFSHNWLRLWSLTVASSLILFSSCAPPADISDSVELIVGSGRMEPATTFELRFAQPIATNVALGQPTPICPLLIRPPLSGQFVWLSERSGVFTPSEPTRLGTAYQFTLRPGLTRQARLRRVLRTPPFTLIANSAGESPAMLACEPRVQLAFNADVAPQRAQPFIEFRNDAGLRIPAVIEPMADAEYSRLSYSDEFSSLLTWREEFNESPRRAVSPARTSRAPRAPVANRLVAVPMRPLPVGSWHLELAEGLPAVEEQLTLPSSLQLELGKVVALTVSSVEALNTPRAGRRIEVKFSRPISASIPGTNLMRWLQVKPAVPDLSLRHEGDRLTLSGSFGLGLMYQLSLLPGLPAEESNMTMSVTYTATNLFFTPVPPRLYFPAFSSDQLASGSRDFELVAINHFPVRLRVKQLDRHTLVHTLRAYERYFRDGRNRFDSDEPYQEVPYELVAGRTVMERLLPPAQRRDEAERRSLSWDDLIGAGKVGAFFIEAEQALGPADSRTRQGTQALIQLTDLGLAWKSSANELTIFVFSHATGRPVTNALVRTLTSENVPLAEGRTDPSGIVQLPFHENGAWLMAERGEDLHALSLREPPLSLYQFRMPLAWQDEKSTRRVLLFTDRPLYRPGESVHFKSILRERAGDQLRIPEPQRATLKCWNARSELFLETNLLVDARGAGAATVRLPESMRGTFQFELLLQEQSFRHWIDVQDFQPDAFAISVPARPEYAAGETVMLPVTAQYLFGQSLEQAQLRWALEYSDAGFAPDGFERFQFCTAPMDETLARTRGGLSAVGESVWTNGWALQPELSFNRVAPQPCQSRFAVEMTDLNQQTLSSHREFLCHSSDFYLGWKRLDHPVSSGVPLSLQLVAVHANGQPMQQTLVATVSVTRVEWRTLRTLEAGHAAGYRSEALLTNLLTRSLATSFLERRGQAWTLRDGENSGLQFIPPEAGSYLIEAFASDTAGRPVVSAMLINASGPESPAWPYRNAVKLDIVADKLVYQPGEIATLLVQTPIAGHALVTVERDDVRHAFVQELTASATTLRIPVRADDAPNVFVSVLLIRGASQSPLARPEPEYRLGYCQLLVTNPATRLEISLRPSSTNYRPADDVEITATILDAGARPVTDASVTLFAVDEGVLRLGGQTTVEPHGYFHQERPLAVECRLSLPHLFPEEPLKRDFGNKGYLVGGGGRALIRKNFAATAFWADDLRTDSAGRVVARFKAPDSLTRYRLVAVAHAGDAQFGSAESALTIDKPLLLEPALPQFTTLGDHLDARTVVHNLTDHPAEVEVSLGLDTLARSDRPLQRVVAVPGKGSVKVEFPLEMQGLGTANWTWRARFVEGSSTPPGCGGFADAVQSSLLIGPLAPLLRDAQSFRSDGGDLELLARANPQLLEGTATLTLRLSNTRLSELGEACSQLLHYPYGCVEQTSSSLLPWLVLKRFPFLSPEHASNTVAVTRAIDSGVRRLLSMQTSEGGLSYWPGGREPMAWGSAYGGLTLALAQKAGASVPTEPFGQLLRYLRDGLKEISFQSRNPSEQCLALVALALAGKPEPAYHERLFQNRAQLTGEDAALLAIAVAESSGAPSMLAELLQAQATTVRSETPFGCDARTLAIRLLAWLRYRPADPEIERTLLALLGHAKNAHWTTTQGNAWTLLALADYAERAEGAVNNVQGSIQFGESTKTFALPPIPTVREFTFALDGTRRQLLLTHPKNSRQNLYVNWGMEGRPRVGPQPRQDAGFSLARQYFKLNNDGTESPTNEFRVGDRVLVKLRISSRTPAQYVAINDPLPAAFEAVNPNFRSRSVVGTGTISNAAGTDWHSDFREIRSDRVLFFRNYLPPGAYEIQYLARVRAAGHVTAPPAKVEEMYHPERFGLAESLPVVSRSN